MLTFIVFQLSEAKKNSLNLQCSEVIPCDVDIYCTDSLAKRKKQTNKTSLSGDTQITTL